jgi:hypothetical protein
MVQFFLHRPVNTASKPERFLEVWRQNLAESNRGGLGIIQSFERKQWPTVKDEDDSASSRRSVASRKSEVSTEAKEKPPRAKTEYVWAWVFLCE